MAAIKYNLQRSRIASTIVFDMDDVNGGDSGDAYDSVVVTHYVRLLWFFHLYMCVSLSATCTESYKQIFYSLTFTTSSSLSSLPSLPPTVGETSTSAMATVAGAAIAVAMVIMVKPRTKRRYFNIQ